MDKDLAKVEQTMGKRPALIVVDVTKGFTDPTSPLGCEASLVVEANRRLIAAFHAKGLTVVFTTVVYHSPEEASVFRTRLPALNILTPESDWVKIDPRLPFTDKDWIIEKLHASAFHGTKLADELRARNVDSIVVTGLTTSGCVRATAVDGLQENFKVFVPSDAVGDRNKSAHLANLHDLNAKYAEVSDSETILLSLANI